MPTTIKYSNNPNSDTAFVVQDGGQKNRAVLTAEPAGTLQLSDSANVSTGYVTDEDGKKHKVNLVAQLEGDIEFSENPNSTKGYATVDGKKHRVVLTASLHGGGGSAPVIDTLNVTPTTSAQTITAPSGTDGYSPVNVAAVTSAIDANIVAGNIKKDVSILGVTGSYEGVAPSGTKSITTNGVHDVAGYASADVQVPTTAPALYREFQLNGAGKLVSNTTTTHIMDFTGMTDTDSFMLAYAYYHNTAISGAVDMSSLTTLSGSQACYNMFSGCTGLTSVDMSSLTTLSGSMACNNMFSGCTGLTSVDLSSLTTISNAGGCSTMFAYCTALTSVNLSGLTTISGSNACNSMFQYCTSLATVYIGGTTAIDFGTQTNQFNNIFTGCSQNIDVYAPAANQAKIESFSGYPNFGGTGTVTWHWRS